MISFNIPKITEEITANKPFDKNRVIKQLTDDAGLPKKQQQASGYNGYYRSYYLAGSYGRIRYETYNQYSQAYDNFINRGAKFRAEFPENEGKGYKEQYICWVSFSKEVPKHEIVGYEFV